MNEHILMVQGFLLYPENYTKEQLKQNFCAAASAADVASAAADAAAYAADAAAYAEYSVSKYFKHTGESRQEYINVINKDNKQ